MVLLSETEFRYYLSVLFDVHRFKIIEHSLSATYHFEKSATRMFIVVVEFKMLVQVIDSLSQKGDLNFRGTRVAVVSLELFDNCRFLFFFQIVYPPEWKLFAMRRSQSVEYSHYCVASTLQYYHIQAKKANVFKPFSPIIRKIPLCRKLSCLFLRYRSLCPLANRISQSCPRSGKTSWIPRSRRTRGCPQSLP